MGMEIMLKMTMNMTDDEETGTWCTVYSTEILTRMQCDTHSVNFTVHGTMLTIKDGIMQYD